MIGAAAAARGSPGGSGVTAHIHVCVSLRNSAAGAITSIGGAVGVSWGSGGSGAPSMDVSGSRAHLAPLLPLSLRPSRP